MSRSGIRSVATRDLAICCSGWASRNEQAVKGKKRAVDTNEIKHFINRVKQGEFDQGDALLIEKLLSILLTIVSLLERKHTSIQRMKELLFGMKEKKRGDAGWNQL